MKSGLRVSGSIVVGAVVLSAVVLGARPGLTATTPADPPVKPDATAPATAGTTAETPDVATLLFSTPQWGQAPAGAVLKYAYSRKATVATYGQSFDDTVTVTLGAGDDAQSRTAEMTFFTGPRRVPAGPFQSDQQNPVLLVVLENNIQELSKLFKANPRYLKNAIRKAWRDAAKIEKTDIDVAGKSVPGTRVSVTPFLDNPEADKMQGLDTMTYVVEIADSVPGQIATIDIHAPTTGAATFSEVLRYQSVTKP